MLLLISCDVSTVLPAAVPTPVPGAVNTIVALTAQSAASATAAFITPTLTSTPTPLPTKTPTITPSPTPTFLFFLLTPTSEPAPSAAGTGSYTCALTDQTPADGVTIAKGQTFETTWTVKNTGTATWTSSSVDFVFVNGTNFASIKRADLPQSVAPGATIALKLTMKAPSTVNSYTTTWSLEQGSTRFCKVNLSIVVGK